VNHDQRGGRTLLVSRDHALQPLGAWVLHRGGMDADRIARRSVAFFLIKSSVNFIAGSAQTLVLEAYNEAEERATATATLRLTGTPLATVTTRLWRKKKLSVKRSSSDPTAQ